jgi:hypothetical protein
MAISAARRTAWSAWFWSGSCRALGRVHYRATITAAHPTDLRLPGMSSVGRGSVPSLGFQNMTGQVSRPVMVG